MFRVTQSLLFAVIYSIYLVAVMLPVQELILRPLFAFRPDRRPAVLGWWFGVQARWVLGLAGAIGGLRLRSEGALPDTPTIVVMNHQSLLDIPVAVRLLRGRYPIIPTRAMYTRWIPGISGLARLAGFPALSQSGRASRAEHAAIVRAAEAVERGERSMIIYPEGHRSHDGTLQPFMTQGLKLIFRHAGSRPIFLAVIDGAWRLRGLGDIAFRLAGQSIRVRVAGPYVVPRERGEHEGFIETLRAEMLAQLKDLSGRDRPGPLAATGDPQAREPHAAPPSPIGPHASLVG